MCQVTAEWLTLQLQVVPYSEAKEVMAVTQTTVKFLLLSHFVQVYWPLSPLVMLCLFLFTSLPVVLLLRKMDRFYCYTRVSQRSDSFLLAFFFILQGSLEIFTGFGLVLGPPLGGFLYQSFGYEVPFITLGCVVLLLVPVNMCVLPKYGKHSSSFLLIHLNFSCI